MTMRKIWATWSVIRFCLTAFMVVALNLGVCVRLHAQGAEATILGSVSDPSGALVPNASVSIKHLSTGILRNVLTNNEGFYSVPGLLPGRYEVTATSPGFATTVATDIVLKVGAQQDSYSRPTLRESQLSGHLSAFAQSTSG